jgi:hypothetical protein
MTEELKIIASIEQSTMVDCWTEYLCLHRTFEGKWCIDIRSFEMVGEASDYEDDDGKLPDQIDGYDVVGIEDGYVTIDHLVLHSDDYPSYEFDKFDVDEFDAIFRPNYATWCKAKKKIEIRKAILSFGGE